MFSAQRSGASLPPPPKRDAAPAAGNGDSKPKPVAAADAKPAADERPAREESKQHRSDDATNGASARHQDVAMTDAPPPADERRRTNSKAADKGAGDGAGEQDEVTRLHVGRLTRNVKEEHVREIFGTFGKLKVSWVVPHS